MSELDELKKRITDSAFDGLETSVIREDYEPAGQMMINSITKSGDFISQRSPDDFGFHSGPWKVWAVEFAPK